MTAHDQTSAGCLVLLSTPIGNLDDISFRAKETLTTAKYVVAEDTRVYADLMRLLNLPSNDVQVCALHDHNQESLKRPLEWLALGHQVVMVSDAGSPIVSDPAYPLVQAVLEAGFKLETCPGVSAPLVALELSGLPPHPFTFHGFLPRENGKRQSFFEHAQAIAGTHIMFEAPHRIVECVTQLCASVPAGTPIVIGRELTKKFESIYRFNSEDWDDVKADVTVKGEFVLLFHISRHSVSAPNQIELVDLAQKYLNKPSTKGLAKLLSKLLDRDTQELYQQLGKRD